jgi:hypothetical protein
MLVLNDKVKLFLCDHEFGPYGPEKKVGTIANVEVTPLLAETNACELIAASPADATHLLVHLRPLQRMQARSGQWPKSIHTNQIVFCLSTLDGLDDIEFPHRSDEIGGFRRITLFSRNGLPINDSQTFAEFCELDIERAAAIVDGDATALSPSLRQAFFRSPDRYLSALAILCQVYLILHASASLEFARASKDVHAALDDMGFWAALTEQEPLTLPADAKQKAETMTAQWWMDTLTNSESGSESAVTILTRIQKEWEGLTHSWTKDKQESEYGREGLQALLRAIGFSDNEGKGVTPTVQAAPDPVIVARAYRAIKSALTGL